MDEKTIPIFTEIFKTLDETVGNGEIDGLQVLGGILLMPDEQFEALKPALFNSIEQVFNAPDAKIALAQIAQNNGIFIEDFTDVENIINSISELSVQDVELSDSKKDFLRFILAMFVNTLQQTNSISHRIITIPVEVCRDSAKLPTYATNGSAAMDIYSPADYTLNPGDCIIIPTGLKVNIPIGYALLIQPRSGMSRKTKLRVANTPGLIDSDYHEEIGVIVENIDPPLKDFEIQQDGEAILQGPLYGSSFTIGKGERFAQMRLVEVPLVNWLPVESLGEFENDHGKGFGSTGTT